MTPLVPVRPEPHEALHVPMSVPIRLSWMQLRASGLSVPGAKVSDCRARPAEPGTGSPLR